ncbi:macrocin-O-methyltransferase [Aureococcus anophagefferens]|nr:macrocin-O-methyltransferase [Aureococcus anophagefferens]
MTPRHAAGPAASGGSEEAARDTARPRTEDLEDGVPLPLRAHGLEALRALAAASANTAERRVQKKNIQFDAARSSWQHLFDPSKSDSLLARGYAAKGGTGADYGRYWITAAGLEYLAAVDRAHVADADADEDLDLVDAAAADDDDHVLVGRFFLWGPASSWAAEDESAEVGGFGAEEVASPRGVAAVLRGISSETRTLQNKFSMFWSMREAVKLMVAHEAARGAPYALVVNTRFDVHLELTPGLAALRVDAAAFPPPSPTTAPGGAAPGRQRRPVWGLKIPGDPRANHTRDFLDDTFFATDSTSARAAGRVFDLLAETPSPLFESAKTSFDFSNHVNLENAFVHEIVGLEAVEPLCDVLKDAQHRSGAPCPILAAGVNRYGAASPWCAGRDDDDDDEEQPRGGGRGGGGGGGGGVDSPKLAKRSAEEADLGEGARRRGPSFSKAPGGPEDLSEATAPSDDFESCGVEYQVPSGETARLSLPVEDGASKVYAAALAFAARHGLSAGAGCADVACVAYRLAAELRARCSVADYAARLEAVARHSSKAAPSESTTRRCVRVASARGPSRTYPPGGGAAAFSAASAASAAAAAAAASKNASNNASSTEEVEVCANLVAPLLGRRRDEDGPVVAHCVVGLGRAFASTARSIAAQLVAQLPGDVFFVLGSDQAAEVERYCLALNCADPDVRSEARHAALELAAEVETGAGLPAPGGPVISDPSGDLEKDGGVPGLAWITKSAERWVDLITRAATNFLYLGGDADHPRDYDPRIVGVVDHWGAATSLTALVVPAVRVVEMCSKDAAAKGTAGDFLEAGVWRGGVGLVMRASALAEAEATHKTPRRTWLFDTFRGIPVDTKAAGGFEEPVDAWPERYACPREEVYRHFARFGVFDEEEVIGVEGLFNDTSARPDIAEALRARGLAVLHVDGDSYASVASALWGFGPHLREGRFGIIEDCHLPSARAAVVDHFASLKEAAVLRFVRDPRGGRSRNGVGGKNAFWRQRRAGPGEAGHALGAVRAAGRAARVRARAPPRVSEIAAAVDALTGVSAQRPGRHYDGRSAGWSLLPLRAPGGRLDDARSNEGARNSGTRRCWPSTRPEP